MTISMEIDGSMNDEVVSYSWQVDPINLSNARSTEFRYRLLGGSTIKVRLYDWIRVFFATSCQLITENEFKMKN